MLRTLNEIEADAKSIVPWRRAVALEYANKVIAKTFDAQTEDGHDAYEWACWIIAILHGKEGQTV